MLLLNVIACRPFKSSGPFKSEIMAATLKQFKTEIDAGTYINGATVTLHGGTVVAAKR